MTRTALVTGANRGIGFETALQLSLRGLRVVVASRERELGEQAARKIRDSGGEALPTQLDLTEERSIEACADRLAAQEVDVDVLVNNGAVYSEGELLELETQELEAVFRVNFLGAFWTCRTFVPSMVERGYGRVVNVSSEYGAFAAGLQGPAAYALSKAALNALTLRLSSEVTRDVKVNSVCPGWVRTRMGGPGAELSPQDAVDTILWLATLSAEGPNGGFFRERRAIAW